MSGFFTRHGNVFTYVPNLIGYVRVACALYSFSVAFYHPVQAVLFYFFAFVCDELDGRFARKYNQTSTFGALLDMVTDRVSTSGLLCILCMIYPQLSVLFIALLMLDIFSHWFQMYSTLLEGNATHKDVKSRSWLVRTYYKHRLFMGFCCVCVEVLYLCMYMANFPELTQFRLPGVPISLPKQLEVLAPEVMKRMYYDGLPAVVLLGVIATPGALIKQICNWVQFSNASKSLVEFDQRKDKEKTN